MSLIGLVDCNNFFASCERVFEPNLQNRPIVVLSNNDGCVIARSQEAKDLGIPMGEPYFKVKAMRHPDLVVRSSNYALYGDMSARVFNSLRLFTPEIEIYSIDECFINLDKFSHGDLKNYGGEIRQKILQWTGMPISLGIAPTKTLSKIAARFAKKGDGCEVLRSRADLHYGLANTPIGDVWGVGRRWARSLRADGIYTALDMTRAPDAWLRKKMGVVGLRTAQELRGIPAHGIEQVTPDKQSIRVSRSFGQMLHSQDQLEDVIKTFSLRASEKLRRGHLVAQQLHIFLRTNRHREDQPQYRGELSAALPYPTSDSRIIQKTALACLKRTYRAGYHYKQAGVLLYGLTHEDHMEYSLFAQETPDSAPLMQALDQINRRYGEGSINIGQCRKERSWYATRNHVSPRYTTSWQELPKVR